MTTWMQPLKVSVKGCLTSGGHMMAKLGYTPVGHSTWGGTLHPTLTPTRVTLLSPGAQ